MNMKNIVVMMLLMAGLLAGCQKTQPTDDPLVSRAEALRPVAFATFDAWLFIEHQNRDIYRTNFTEAHDYSEQIRTNAASLLRFLEESRAAQKTNPNETNRRTLATAIAIVESHLRVCQNYIGEADQKSEGKK